jgi:hypothetical protein
MYMNKSILHNDHFLSDNEIHDSMVRVAINPNKFSITDTYGFQKPKSYMFKVLNINDIDII